MRILDLIALSCAISTACHAKAEVPAKEACSELKGVETFSKFRKADYIIFGEAHGTTELPQVFGDLVCHLSVDQPVTVALEFLPAEQAQLDTFLRSDGDIEATSALLASEGWLDQHGRASRAIYDLLDYLRKRIAAGADIAVVAFDHPSERPGTSSEREKGMARNLLRAKLERPAARVVVLTGSAHAGRSQITSFGPSFYSMAQLLPADRTVTMTFRRAGGEAWGCRLPPEGSTLECKPWPGTVREPISPRGVDFVGDREGFDSVVSVGRPYSASAPARMTFDR